VARRLAHLVRYRCKTLLDGAQVRSERSGQRNAEKGERPVGFDLEEPLRQRTEPHRRQAAIKDEHPRQPVGILPKIGDDLGRAILDQRMATADRIEAIYVFRRLFRPRQHVQTDAADDRPGWCEAMLERIFARRIPGFGIERCAPQVRRKLRVLLAVEIALFECQAVKRRVIVGQRRTHAARQFRQRRLVLRQIAVIHEGELHQDARRFDQEIWSGVDLVDGHPPIFIGGHPIDELAIG